MDKRNRAPNPQQKTLIKSKEGIYVVDAGAGTGKTFTITRRYAKLLQDGYMPDDILLITFTNNAADEMKKHVINYSDYDPVKLQEAPISTFHSLCKRILEAHGFDSPRLLGVNDSITSSTRIIENNVLEQQEFRRFYNRFMDRHPEYNNFYRIVWSSSQLLDLIKSLGAKGIFPTREGWYRHGEQYLDGDFEAFKPLFEEKNAPRYGGSRQSELRQRLSNYDKKCYPLDAPDKRSIRGDGKHIAKEFMRRAFEHDRTELKQFIHDLYFAYIQYALSRNYLNFSFLMMFAFALLCENHQLRQELSFDYIMVDEFQDTNEIQYKLTLLLSKQGNIMAVGDWKQSIYKFQYAAVENITHFKQRLNRYTNELNEDYPRIEYPIDEINLINLTTNYRSTQQILDFAEQSLALAATQYENLDTDSIMAKVTSLISHREDQTDVETNIEVIESANELEAVLSKIVEIVDNPDYQLEDPETNNLRTPEYGDIAVLTRRSKFGLDLQRKARNYGIPASYEAGVELFKTDPALLLLAWLRVLEDKHSTKGWSVILEHTGYTLDEIQYILTHRDYPSNLIDFRNTLWGNDISTIARLLFDTYQLDNGFTDKIIEVLRNTFTTTYMNIGELIQFIEDNIELEETYDVDHNYGDNVVTIQTIHAAKGLEYPIVIIPDLNRQHFPSTTTDTSTIQYHTKTGLRQTKLYATDPYPYQYDNWRTELLHKCLSGQYDEERRLLYVAMTRARDHLILTAESDTPSEFFYNLTKKPTQLEPSLQPTEKTKESTRSTLQIQKPRQKTPITRSVHSILQTSLTTSEKGKEYGEKIHNFAKNYRKGEEINPSNIDERHVANFLDGLKGTLQLEQKCILPLETAEKTITLKGKIDLLHITEDTVNIIDFKTDRDTEAREEHRKQLSIYYHVVNNSYTDKHVKASIFYTSNSTIVQINPLPLKKLTEIVQKR